MWLNINHIQGQVVKDDHRYVVRDNTFLKDIAVSSTELKPSMSTGGHAHDDQAEVCYFVAGRGLMELQTGNLREMRQTEPGDLVLIPRGTFHRVHNVSETENCYFVCIFTGERTQT